MKTPDVSIVVPIYNVEKYLEICVDSLINQSLENIEIILVDDGSTDNSGTIADKLKDKDDRIVVVHKENGGLGPARNTGLSVATGKYVAFLDSDDWVKLDMYEKLFSDAKKYNVDIVVSGHCDYTDGNATKVKKHPLAGKYFKSQDEILSVRKNLYGHYVNSTVTEAFPMSVCMSIYKRDLILNNDISFKNILSEDTLFNLDIYKVARAIYFAEYTDYCYRKENQKSITGSFSNKKFKQYKQFLLELRKRALLENDDECIVRAQKTAIDYCRLYIGIVNSSDETMNNKIKFIDEFATDKDIQKCWNNYPISTLPLQQRIFQYCVLHKLYLLVLVICNVKKIIKK